MTTKNVTIEYANRHPGDKAYRYNHDGFEVGSKWLDLDEGEVVTIVGPGMAGMPECECSDGRGTYLAYPQRLTQDGI